MIGQGHGTMKQGLDGNSAMSSLFRLVDRGQLVRGDLRRDAPPDRLKATP
jgi:hypothetical protein